MSPVDSNFNSAPDGAHRLRATGRSAAPERRRQRARRVVGLVVTTLIASITMVVSGTVAHAQPTTLCVGGPGCFASLQAALDASHDGDTIHLGRGTFAGGVTITTSVTLRGAGANVTSISGGGPVITIGAFDATTEPTVTLDKLTVRDGLTTTVNLPGQTFPYLAYGGGILIPYAHDRTPGATVTISNSVITHNRVEPSASIPLPIGIAGNAEGAGIFNLGVLSLLNDQITGNTATGANSSSDNAGGVFTAFAPLTMTNTNVTGNSVVGAQFGQLSNAGGIIVGDSSSLTMNGGEISDNTVSLNSDFPPEVDTVAFAGGLWVSDGATSATVSHARLSNNTVSAATVTGSTTGYGGAIATDASLTLSDSVVSGNHVTVTADTPPNTLGSVFAASGGLDLAGAATITRTIVVNNTVDVSSSTGVVLAVSGGISTLSPPDQPIAISDSVVSANTVTATAASGAAIAQGGGISNNGTLSVTRTAITGNTATAKSPGAVSQGGGIYNSTVPGTDLPIVLTLTDTLILANRLTTNAGGTRQGGGLYTTVPVTITRGRILANSPDQCFGCS
jgi:hypothetical protein